MTSELIEDFSGPLGKAEVYEVVTAPTDGLGVEQVEYQVMLNGELRETVLTMGEASVLACELSGDQRFSGSSR